MQFPVLLVTPPPVGEDYYEIKERPPVTAIRAVDPHATFYREQGLPTDRQHPEQQADTQEAPPQPYQGSERRAQCRRVIRQSILLDTRSDRDRRRPDHSGDVPTVNVDEEA